MPRIPKWVWILAAVAAVAVYAPRILTLENFNDYKVAKKVIACPDGTRSQDGKCLMEL
jgi:hypothetical protein